MCTAVSFRNGDHYFGRNLDLEYAYREQITITPRNFPFHFRNGYKMEHHYAMIGMATVSNDYPLYYDATNERGLSIAGLNFPGIAAYLPKACGKDNIAPFEVIPWILGQCASVEEASALFLKMNIWALPFSREFLLSPLHWMVSDKDRSIVVEPMPKGLKIYDDPIGVLTNNPPFPYHMYHLADYMNLSSDPAANRFSNSKITPYSNGMGAIGLPGDYSSGSRFVKAAFVRCNSRSDGTENGNVSQFFHILSSVAMPRGSVKVQQGEYEITGYSSCCNTDKGIYYYTTYDNCRISAVDMRKTDLLDEALITYPLQEALDIDWQN